MKNKGFVFVELMIVIAVISVGLVAAMGMINRTQSEINIVRSRLTATYLGQEGLEIVRSIRDRNWIAEDACWLDGLHNEGYDVTLLTTASYNSNSLDAKYVDVDVENHLTRDDFRLYKDSSGYYNHQGTGFTGFFRAIEITLRKDEENKDYLEVDVYVEWEGGVVHISNVLYNWLSIRSNCDE